METPEEIYKRFPPKDKERLGWNVFEVIWPLLENNKTDEINDFRRDKGLNDSINLIEKFYNDEKKDEFEKLYDKFNHPEIDFDDFKDFYQLIKNNNHEIDIHYKRPKNKLCIDLIREFIKNEEDAQPYKTTIDTEDDIESIESGSFSDYSDTSSEESEEDNKSVASENSQWTDRSEWPLDDNGEKINENQENELIQDVDVFNNFYRDNQKEAIKKQREQGFKSGIHAQIMGAGKSYIILQTIDDLNNPLLCNKNTEKNLIFLITYRQEIFRNWFFIKENDDYVLNKEAFNEWKNKGIIDLNTYKIIDCITNKNKNQFENISNDKSIVIINTTFFNNINFDNIRNKLKAIIIDECHLITQVVFTRKLSSLINGLNIPIIGFSATPLRDTKTSKGNLIKFFGNDGKLNIISSYTLMDAIHDGIIVPFKYHLIQSSDGHVEKYEAFDKIFKEIYPTLEYKKISAWTNNGVSLRDWHDYIKKNYKDIKLYINSVFNDQYPNTLKDFNKFKHEENAMMLCINMFKEGTDVPNLDCGIYLDPVKKRSTTVSLQTAGRVLRRDIDKRKKYGTLIDFFVKVGDKKSEELAVDKIIDYYESLVNLTDDMNEKERIKEFKKITNNIELKPTENKIVLKIDDNPYHNCEIILNKNTVDFTKFIQIYNKKVNKLIGVGEEEALKEEFNNSLNIMKNIFKFNINTNFENDYNNQMDKKGLPSTFNEFYEKFKKYLDEKTLYNWLEIDTEDLIQTKKECKKFLNDKKIKINSDNDYYEACKIHNCLPKDPRIFYGINDFHGIIKEFKYKTAIWDI